MVLGGFLLECPRWMDIFMGMKCPPVLLFGLRSAFANIIQLSQIISFNVRMIYSFPSIYLRPVFAGMVQACLLAPFYIFVFNST